MEVRLCMNFRFEVEHKLNRSQNTKYSDQQSGILWLIVSKQKTLVR